MPESSIYDYLAKDHDDATERQVLELFQASLLNAPIAVSWLAANSFLRANWSRPSAASSPV